MAEYKCETDDIQGVHEREDNPNTLFRQIEATDVQMHRIERILQMRGIDIQKKINEAEHYETAAEPRFTSGDIRNKSKVDDSDTFICGSTPPWIPPTSTEQKECLHDLGECLPDDMKVYDDPEKTKEQGREIAEGLRKYVESNMIRGPISGQEKLGSKESEVEAITDDWLDKWMDELGRDLEACMIEEPEEQISTITPEEDRDESNASFVPRHIYISSRNPKSTISIDSDQYSARHSRLSLGSDHLSKKTPLVASLSSVEPPGFHGHIVSKQTTAILMPHLHRDNVYITRRSRMNPRINRSISVTYKQNIVNFRIHEIYHGKESADSEVSYFLFEDGPSFSTLAELFEHYRTSPMTHSGRGNGPFLHEAVDPEHKPVTSSNQALR